MRKAKIANLDVVLGGGPDREGGGTGPMLLLLHGYGAPGEDLVPLARQLTLPPTVRFAFPAAPLVLEQGLPPEHSGRAWWHIDMVELQRATMQRDYSALMERTPDGLTEAREAVVALLEVLEREHSVPPSQLILGGFSQGAMLATDVALRSERAPAGLAILSGALIARSEWVSLMKARAGLPVMQSHGRTDPVLSYAVAEALRDELMGAGVSVEFVAFNGGHGIPNGAIEALQRLVTRATA